MRFDVTNNVQREKRKTGKTNFLTILLRLSIKDESLLEKMFPRGFRNEGGYRLCMCYLVFNIYALSNLIPHPKKELDDRIYDKLFLIHMNGYCFTFSSILKPNFPVNFCCGAHWCVRSHF